MIEIQLNGHVLNNDIDNKLSKSIMTFYQLFRILQAQFNLTIRPEFIQIVMGE